MKTFLPLLFISLHGCAGTFTGICLAVPAGETDSGITAVRVYCQAQQ